MKKILAIALTCLLVAAFAVALVACDPVEKSEKISATVEDLNEIIANEPFEDFLHYRVTRTSESGTYSAEVYMIDRGADGRDVYADETREDGSRRIRAAVGSANTAILGSTLVSAGGELVYNYAFSENSPWADDHRTNYDMVGVDATTIFNAISPGEAMTEFRAALGSGNPRITSALRYIRGKEVTKYEYTIEFNIQSADGSARGSAMLVTDGSGKVTEVSCTDESGTITVQYIYDFSGEQGFDWLAGLALNNFNDDEKAMRAAYCAHTGFAEKAISA